MEREIKRSRTGRREWGKEWEKSEEGTYKEKGGEARRGRQMQTERHRKERSKGERDLDAKGREALKIQYVRPQGRGNDKLPDIMRVCL